tara:strand:- start:125 stop:457 length:333 start_codon:yes stop_codon:yes gene_type:complete
MKDQDLVPQVIDLGAHRKGELNETFLAAMGEWIKTMLRWTFGENVFFPSKVKGTQSEVNSFMKALERERGYMQSYRKHGLGDERTYRNKYRLDQAVKDFEQETKLKWPFK